MNTIMALTMMLLPEPQAAAQADAAEATYIQDSFQRIDANGDGMLDRTEWQTFMQRRISDQRVAFDAAFAKADLNRDGRLSKTEAARANGDLVRNFAMVDEDRDGFVSPAEIRQAIVDGQADQLPPGSPGGR